jgi:hypothetical protein
MSIFSSFLILFYPIYAAEHRAEVEKAIARVRDKLTAVAPDRLQSSQAVYEIVLSGAGGSCWSISSFGTE